MSSIITALPVTVEQIAVAVRKMSRVDQQHLLDLVPDLRQLADQPSARTVGEAIVSLEAFRGEVMAALDGQPLSANEPFFQGLTLGQYEALTDEQKADLWDDLTEIDLMDMEEVEVGSDALPAR